MNESQEIGHVWFKDPILFTYLREGTTETLTPDKPIQLDPAEATLLVGYAKVKAYKDSVFPPGEVHYSRRFWFLKAHDRDLKPDPDGGYANNTDAPAEAVDPHTIKVGKPSKIYRPRKRYHGQA